MLPILSELPFHIHDWFIISLKDFCIVIRKWPTFWPSRLHKDITISQKTLLTIPGQVLEHAFISFRVANSLHGCVKTSLINNYCYFTRKWPVFSAPVVFA